MKVVLLGTAAGGGFPQWNCACAMCKRAGSPGVPARSQDGLAISADGSNWYLLNASPDLRAQILSTPALAPGPGRRDTPIRGVLLTDAELDHTLGLVLLREASELRIWGPPPVVRAFPMRSVLDRYHAWDWESGPVALEGLAVTGFPVSGKRPRYAADSSGDGWVVAYRVEDPATGGVLVYAPCLAEWPEGFESFTAGASVVLLDGTFYSADELSVAAGREAPAGPGSRTPMGHLPVVESLPLLTPGLRWVYTHLNNTNPLLDKDSLQRRSLVDAEVLDDGTELTL